MSKQRKERRSNRRIRPKALTAAVALLLVIAACGGGGTTETTATDDPGVTPTTAEPGGPTTTAEPGATTTSAEPAEMVSLEVTLAGAAELTTAPLFVADALGFFEEEHLEVEFLPAGGGGNAAAILLGGDAPMGSFTASHAFTAAAEGQFMPILAPMAVGYQGLFFMVNADVAAERGLDPDAPLSERLKNLEGLTVGISSPGSTTDNLARLVATEAGLDPDSQITIVPLGGVPEATDAMVEGRVDAAISVLPVSAGAEAEGAIALFDFGQDFESLNVVIFSAILANDSWLADNRDTAVRFLTAVARALDAIEEDPAAAYGAAYEPHFSEAVPEQELYDNSWPRLSFGSSEEWGLPDELLIGTYENQVRDQLGITIDGFDPSMVADQSVVADALERLP